MRHRCHPTKSPLFPIYTGIQALYWPNTIYKGIKALFWVTHSILGLVLYVCLSIQRLGYIGGIESPNKKGNCWTKHCEIIFFVKKWFYRKAHTIQMFRLSKPESLSRIQIFGHVGDIESPNEHGVFWTKFCKMIFFVTKWLLSKSAHNLNVKFIKTQITFPLYSDIWTYRGYRKS